MAQDLPQASDADSRADLPLNSQTISQMTSAEIYKKNRQRHEGTFMDRSWKYKLGDATEEMMQDGLTFKEKFWMGAYTYQGIINRFQYRLNTKQEKVQFLEDILNRKDQYEERD